MYADDICLMAPKIATMQYLLHMCHEYGKENDILFKGGGTIQTQHCTVDINIALFNSYCTSLCCSFLWTD